VGGTPYSAKDASTFISLNVIDLLVGDSLNRAAFSPILRSNLLTTLRNNDVSGKVNASGVRECFGQVSRDADIVFV
jgi:hypothetical protein